MKTLLICTLALWSGLPCATEVAPEPVTASQTSLFTWVDVHVDSGKEPLAAWQVEFKAAAGAVRIVGIEGGEHEAYREPPFYDPRARLRGERVVIAAFSTARDLPAGRTRVARIHLQLLKEGTPGFETKLKVAATLAGRPIEARASWELGR